MAKTDSTASPHTDGCPLSGLKEKKASSRQKSETRSRFEHVFCAQAQMGGHPTLQPRLQQQLVLSPGCGHLTSRVTVV